jgi:lycopene cyclase domain-containing protein
MSYWMFDVLALGLPTALLLRRSRGTRRLWGAVLVLAALALVWTAPWDDYLVRSGVWSYDSGRVLARIGSVPAEEYAFVVLLVVLVAAWGARTGRLPGSPRPALLASGRARLRGTAGWLAVAALGVLLLLAGDQLRYLGLLLVWAAPPLALQRGVAGDLLRRRQLDRAVIGLPVVAWLCLADRLALADGVWVISPATSTGVLLLGLPVEEALFFLLTVLLVTDGLVLATDDRALARVRALVQHFSRLAVRRSALPARSERGARRTSDSTGYRSPCPPPLSSAKVPSGPAGAGRGDFLPGIFFPTTPLTDSVE